MFNAWSKIKELISSIENDKIGYVTKRGNESLLDDIPTLLGNKYKSNKPYFVNFSPTNSGVFAGGTTMILGYQTGQYGFQIAYLYAANFPKVRIMRNGVWNDWTSLVQNITTGTEFETGRIIDGKKEYAKRFAAVTLPSSASNKIIQTGLTNINFIKLEGSISKTDGSENSNLPWSYTGQPDVYHYYSNTSKNITIRVSGDMSNYQVVETIYYTKN